MRSGRLAYTLVVLAVLLGPPRPHSPSGEWGPALLYAAPPIKMHQGRDLVFGVVLPGVTIRIDPLDPDAGRYRVRINMAQEIRVEFLSLPTALMNGGQLMPVEFGPSDAAWTFEKNGTNTTVFDPLTPQIIQVPNKTKEIYIHLGGTLRPDAAQLPGDYVEAVTLDVTDTGL